MATDYYEYIIKGEVYCLSNGQIKHSNKYNPTDNTLEINMHSKSTIEHLKGTFD